MKKILLLLFLISCSDNKKDMNDKLNIHITKNDSVVKTVTAKKNERYIVLGENKDFSKIILSDNTIKKARGDFALGIYDKINPNNRVLVFNNHPKNNISDFINNISSLAMEEEFMQNLKYDGITSLLLDDFSNTDWELKNRVLKFAFIDKNKDTLGFQNSFYVQTNNKLISVYY